MSKLKKEASTAGAVGGSKVSDIKGFSAPFGSKPGKKKKNKKNNPNKPYGDAELFENAVALSLLGEDDFEEVVRKRGNQWVLYDDETEVEKGTYSDRETAWEKQRGMRRSDATREKSATSEKERQRRSLTPDVEKQPLQKVKDRPTLAKKTPKRKVSKVSRPVKHQKFRRVESVMRDLFKPVMSEGSVISYVFENLPSSDETSTWDKFMGKLSKESILADPKLKKILSAMAKAEAQLLGKAIDAIKSSLNGPSFEVKRGPAEQDPETKDVMLKFEVNIKEKGVKLPFSMKIDNSKPLIVWPQASRQAINDMADKDSKLLRAELMHIQETILDRMEEVALASKKRDVYLKKMEGKIDKFLSNIGPLEISMLKYLLKNKYKGVR